MLGIKQVRHLARTLGVSDDYLQKAGSNPSSFIEHWKLVEADSGNSRDVINVTGALKYVQRQILDKILMPKLIPSVSNHGGIRRRSIRSNVEAHLSSRFVYSTDIAKFFRSISHRRIYALFSKDFECAPDVSRLLTHLCTYRHHLALGLPTSPFLADQVLKPVDARINRLCQDNHLVYTRFVDDISISGPFSLDNNECSLIAVIESILEQNGFRTNQDKRKPGVVGETAVITKLRIVRGHVDVLREYLDEVEKTIARLRSFASGGALIGPYFSRSQVQGKVAYIGWINPRRRSRMNALVRDVNWERVESRAKEAGLVVYQKTRMERAP